MRAVYLDTFAGISGNMLLGAFLQVGVPEAHLRNELQKLPLGEEYNIKISDVNKTGINAVYVDVELAHRHHSHHTHRTMADIRTMLEESPLSTGIKQTSLAIFQTLAEAEGKVHGLSADEVHFHEVGAVDSIVDVVGTAVCLDYLEIDKIFAAKLNTGTGFVKCAHGLMPIPAPATAELLCGWPTYHQGTPSELTTPTGAAVVKTLAEYAMNLPDEFTAEKIAYGAGSHDLDFPNVLRLYLGEYCGHERHNLALLETNIDDMNPQIYGYLYDRLFAAGALDVWTTAIFMKKNRPAHKLSVLVDNEQQDICAEIILRETTGIGVRIIPVVGRYEATRHLAKVDTKYGIANCKVSAYKGYIVSVSPEYEDCVRLAAEKNVPLKVVQQEAVKVMNERLGD